MNKLMLIVTCLVMVFMSGCARRNLIQDHDITCKYQFDKQCTLPTLVIKKGICMSSYFFYRCNDCGTEYDGRKTCPECCGSTRTII